MFSFGETDDELKKMLARAGGEWTDDLSLPDTVFGRTIMLPANQTVVRLKEYPSTTMHAGQMAHEIFHSVSMILSHVGMRLSDDSEEAYAYLVQHVTAEIYNHMYNTYP